MNWTREYIVFGSNVIKNIIHIVYTSYDIIDFNIIVFRYVIASTIMNIVKKMGVVMR